VDRSGIERAVRNFFEANAGDEVAVYLFGSRARGDGDEHSDVDVAVLLREAPPATLAGLLCGRRDQLQEALGIPVDLIVLNRAELDLIHQILRDGVLVLDRDPSRRIRFEVQARNAYWDLEPFLRRYRLTTGPVR
jgi:predicted nucleotidyltransferase